MRSPALTTVPEVPRARNGFLPDFCSIRVLFVIVVIAELLAFILALAPRGASAERWSRLALLSLFIQWVALSCTALLCLFRARLNRLGNAAAGAGAYALILMTAGFLSEAAYHIGRGTGLEAVLSSHWHTGFMVRTLFVAAIVSAVILRYFYVQNHMRETLEAESRSRLQALQARIRPHFMFNSMNTIASLTRSDPALAEEVVEDLADLFRVSLSDQGHLTSLVQELDLTRRYLKIEALRLGDRLTVDWRADDLPPEVRVPPLVIQPLVENAVYHGIEPLAQGGTVEVSVRCTGPWVLIAVSNPVSPNAAAEPRPGNRMALDNVRDRLRLHYGGKVSMDTRQQGGQFQVTLKLPRHGSVR